MLSIPIKLEDLRDEALNLVAAKVLKTSVKPYITDWSVTGPVIESQGIDLHHHKPAALARGLERLAGIEEDEESRWSASCGDTQEFGRTPLIAAIRALVASQLNGTSVRVPAEAVLDLVKDEWTVVSFLLEPSAVHNVEQSSTDGNRYVLSAREESHSASEFQQIVALARKVETLAVLDVGSRPGASAGTIGTVTVQHG